MRRWLLAPGLPVLGLALVLAAAGSAPAAAEADGKALFEKTCTKCHGPDGSGDTPAGKKMKVPAWDADDFKADTAMKTVRENKKHTTVSKKLSDADLQAIAAYVATLGGS